MSVNRHNTINPQETMADSESRKSSEDTEQSMLKSSTEIRKVTKPERYQNKYITLNEQPIRLFLIVISFLASKLRNVCAQYRETERE